MPENYEKRITEQARKCEKLKEEFANIRKDITRTVKERKKSEKDFLDVIKKQMEYWEDQLKNTDPQKDKERYNEIKGKIKSEKVLIKQIKDELDRIDQELKLEKEHKKI
jgi:septal ring factor EnvC (AmiA/AmiB activator)